MSWKHKAEKLWFNEHESWNNITYALLNHFPGRDFDQAKQTIRSHIRNTERYKQEHQKEISNVVGIIGDLHQPFTHPNYLQFCLDTFKQFKVNRKVSVGDIWDFYCYSRFVKKPIAWTPPQERILAKEGLKAWVEAFPNLDIIWGNHDLRYITHCELNGIDTGIIEDIKQTYDLPSGWMFYDEYENTLIIDDVLYLHGTAYNGKDGAKQAAINEQISVVMGHGHAFAGVFPIANKRKLMFGMNVGCGIDNAAYSFAYNKMDKFKPLLGCGIVFNSGFAIWIPMGQKYLDMKG